MASDAQIAANRLNAQKSTGPRSVEGKAASSMNALQSGVHAQSTIIRGEDPAALEALTAQYYADHAPATAEERCLVDSMVRFEWQLRRLSRVESELWEYKFQDSSRLHPTCPLGHVFSNNSNTLSRLTRQVAMVQRCYHTAVAGLKALRTRVQSPEPDPPQPEAPAETKPIPMPASETDAVAHLMVCGRPLPQPPAETNPISTPDLPVSSRPLPVPIRPDPPLI